MANIPGEVKAINGQTLGVGAFAGVSGLVIEGGDSERIVADPQFLDRSGLPPDFVESGVDAQAINVSFKVADYAGRQATLAAIDYPNTEDTIQLQVYKGDPSSPTLCVADVAVSSLDPGPGDIQATFLKSDTAWRAFAESSLGRTLSFSGLSAVATLINNGHVRAAPMFKLGWTVQRATSSSAVGWKYRRQIEITNNTTQDWEDELITVDAGDTAAWVTATKAQADGDDVRIWGPTGREVYRTLACMNTKKTFIHFLVTLKAGASATYDCVYGNPSANSPRTLSTKALTRKTYAAPDLEGYSGTATAGATTTMTDSGAAWETDRWKDGWIGFLSGTGSVRWRRIASNTGTVITLNRAVVTAPAAGTTYVIFKSGIFFDGGRVTGGVTSTAFQDTAHTRKWGVNQLEGATITFHDGSTTPATVTVVSNTADTITSTPAFSVNPAVNAQFTIQRQGHWSYVVDVTLDDTVHRGVYRENQYYSPPTRTWPNGDTPAGWQTELRLPNDDDFGVYPPYDKGASGGHAKNYWTLPRSYRRISNDNRFIGEGIGDGWSLFSAIGFQGWYFDYFFQNINGEGQAVFAVMDVGGQDWQDVVTDTNTHASFSTVAAQHVDLSAYNNPTRLYMGVLPLDGVACAGGQADVVGLETRTVLEVHHDISAFGGLTDSVYVLGSEVECFQWVGTIRIGGGSDSELVGPMHTIVVGGDDHQIMLPANYELWINTNPGPGVPLIGVYNSTYALQYEAAWAARFFRYPKGEAVGVQTREFAPIPPAINMITNGYFGTNVTGWDTPVVTAGVTLAGGSPSRVSTPDAADGIGTGSMEIDVTAAPVGAWTIRIPWIHDSTLSAPDKYVIPVIPNKNYPLGFAYRATNIGSSLEVQLETVWQGGVSNDPTMELGGAPAAINTWYYDADDEITFYVPPGLVSAFTTTTQANVTILISGTGSYVGKIYIDQVTLGVPNVHVSQTEPGTQYLKASWVKGYLT